MTVEELIEDLQKANPKATVVIEIREPYDEEPALLTEIVTSVYIDSDVSVTLS